MPQTLAAVEGVLDLMRARRPGPVTLLVVPGAGWRPAGIDRLRALADAGCALAGHGWRHCCAPPRTLTHRLHGKILSRNVAEHLSLTPREIAGLMRRCFHWFAARRLPLPALYVPPAWAMGPVAPRTLQRLPFRHYETLTGVYHARARRRCALPVAGYEADTRARAISLRWLNAANRSLARCLGRPLRVAIHPFDLKLLMAGELERDLGRWGRLMDYGEIF